MRILFLRTTFLLAELFIQCISEISTSEPPSTRRIFQYHWSTITTPILSGTTASLYQTIQNNLFEIVQNMDFCKGESRQTKVKYTSCRGRCGERGWYEPGTQTRVCSCHEQCFIDNDCCPSFRHKCGDLFFQGLSLFHTKGLFGACGVDGPSFIAGCHHYNGREYEIQLDTTHSPDLSASNITFEWKTLKAYLGKSVEKIRDKQSGLIFKHRKVFDECKLANSIPVPIPRTVVFHCPLRNAATFDSLDKSRHLNEQPKRENSAISSEVYSYLSGCQMNKVVDKYSTSIQPCDLRASVECYRPSGETYCATISDICNNMTQGWNRNSYGAQPYILFSDQAVSLALKDGTTCFFFLPNKAADQEITDSDSVENELAFITISSVASRKEKSSSNQGVDRSEEQSSTSDVTMVHKYIAEIEALGMQALFECPGLDFYLNQCHLIAYSFETMTEKKSHLLTDQNIYSLQAHLHSMEQENIYANGEVPTLPACRCFNILTAFNSHAIFDVQAKDHERDVCQLEVKVSEMEISKENWELSLKMSAFGLDESLTQGQRDGAAVSNKTSRVPVQTTTAKPHLNLNRSRHAKELPQFYFRSDLMKVLQAIEDIKNYLEDNMAQGPKVCPHDNIRCVRMCFVILKHLTPLEAIQERDGEKCITLDLDRSNSGRLAPCNSSPSIHVIAVSLHMAAVFLACAVHI